MGQINAGRDALTSSGTGWGSIAWNTVVGSVATLGDSIPDVLRAGDALGTVSGDPCAGASDWAWAGLQDGLRAATIASTAGGAAARGLNAINLANALAEESEAIDASIAANNRVADAELNYQTELGKALLASQEGVNAMTLNEQVEAAAAQLASAKAFANIATRARVAATARATGLSP